MVVVDEVKKEIVDLSVASQTFEVTKAFRRLRSRLTFLK